MVTLVGTADPTVFNQVLHLFVGVGPPHAVSKTLPGFLDSKMAAVQTLEHLESHAGRYDDPVTLE